jgi:threonine/homoserine/homoserine lactone efflux protein
MPEFQTLVLFLGAALALNLTPGPDMLYVAARGSGEGRISGIVSALGIAAGCTVHIAALALGLSALLAAVPLAYDLVRWAGGAYLIALGTRALLQPAGLRGGGTVALAPLGRVFRQGVITNVLNPKVALFFLAFIPQFVDPARSSPAGQIVVLGLLFNTSGTLVNLGVAVLASRATGWLRRRDREARLLQRVTGGVFIALGLRLAAAGRR